MSPGRGRSAWACCQTNSPDRGNTPEYNAVDASLWFIVVVHEFLERCEAGGKPASNRTAERLSAACQAVLEGYTAGTRFGIQADHDGLLRAGTPGLQLTWMDVKIGDRWLRRA